MIEIINMFVQMTPAEWLLFVSSIIMLIGAIGLFRFPDIYTRTHAATLITIGGVCLSLFIISAGAILNFMSVYFVELLLVIIFILVTSPVASQAIAESAYKKGIKPRRLFRNDLITKKTFRRMRK